MSLQIDLKSEGPTWEVGIVKVQEKSQALYLGVWGLGPLDFKIVF